jgi:predicted 3-demethylubiquinone-9 3-methyltransferase (glyoxalase superfamily)
MHPIQPCLWFDGQAENAVKFYTSIFKNSGIDKISYYGSEGRGTKGTVLTITFQLNGCEMMALNGGPEYKFTPAISMIVYCDTQEEIDYYWEKLSEGGEKGPCGWLTDPFGVSWQVVPTVLAVLMSDKDEAKAARVTKAMLKMGKLDIQLLKQAYEGIE